MRISDIMLVWRGLKAVHRNYSASSDVVMMRSLWAVKVTKRYKVFGSFKFEHLWSQGADVGHTLWKVTNHLLNFLITVSTVCTLLESLATHRHFFWGYLIASCKCCCCCCCCCCFTCHLDLTKYLFVNILNCVNIFIFNIFLAF